MKNLILFVSLLVIFFLNSILYSQDESKPNLYIVSVGINNYVTITKLKFGISDAVSITEELVNKNKLVYNEVISQILLDDSCTANNVEIAINNVIKNSKPEDTFIFCFAGIGNVYNEEEMNLYLYDFSKNNLGKEENNLIGSWLSIIEAKNQILIIDCNNTPDKLYRFAPNLIYRDSINKIDFLNKNLAIFSNSGVAYESDSIKHGTLTYLILEGIQGKADLNNDKFISIDELRAYLDKNMYPIDKRQIPFSYSVNNFNLAFCGNETDYENMMNSKKRGFETDDKDSASNKVSEIKKRKDKALFIATNDYKNSPNLKNPIYDAEETANELKSNYGFETEILRNGTLQEIYKKIIEYKNKEYNENDRLFIMFSGHGVYREDVKEGFIVCADSKSGKEDFNSSSLFRFSDLRNFINDIHCKHIFIVFDVCFGGAFNKMLSEEKVTRNSTESPDEKYTSEMIENNFKYKTRIALTSGSIETVAEGKAMEHSPFTKKFLLALSKKGGDDRILTTSEILTYVREITESRPLLFGFGSNDERSDFIFIPVK